MTKITLTFSPNVIHYRCEREIRSRSLFPRLDRATLTLESIMANERVHPYTGWADMRRRLAHPRMVFAFEHPSTKRPVAFASTAPFDATGAAVPPR